MARSETFPDLTATTDRLDGSDFNDLENAHGPAAVVESINAAVHGSNATPDADTAPAEDWPEPIPLPDALPPVMPFDVELLPEALRAWVADIAHRMQCPPDFTAVGAVTALSSLIGARAVVNPKTRDDWAVVPNMWGLIVGRPGVMKSPALGEALKTLHRMEANELQAHDAAMQEWDLDNRVEALASEAREKEAKKLAAKDPAAARELLRAAHTAPKPVERRYIINDSTACWGEGVADPLEDLAEWSRLVSQKSGATANNVVMDLKAWQLFSAAPSVKELLDRQRGTALPTPPWPVKVVATWPPSAT